MTISSRIALVILSAIFFGYFFGSILTSEIIKKIYKINPREYFSKNPGATNSIRVFGLTGGTLVLVGDMMKSILATIVVWIITRTILLADVNSKNVCWLIYVTNFFVMIGHIFPVFFKFKGGKGVAVFFGTLIVLSPWITLSAMIIFIFTAIVTKYYSLSSLVGGLVASILVFVPWMDFFYFLGYWINVGGSAVWFANYQNDLIPIVGTGVIILAMFGLICWRHKQNIKRLIKGTENKFNLRIKKRC